MLMHQMHLDAEEHGAPTLWAQISLSVQTLDAQERARKALWKLKTLKEFVSGIFEELLARNLLARNLLAKNPLCSSYWTKILTDPRSFESPSNLLKRCSNDVPLIYVQRQANWMLALWRGARSWLCSANSALHRRRPHTIGTQSERFEWTLRGTPSLRWHSLIKLDQTLQPSSAGLLSSLPSSLSLSLSTGSLEIL